MQCKILFMWIVSLATVSLVASLGYGECSQLNGGNCAHLNQTNTGGTYMPPVNPYPNLTNPNPYPVQFLCGQGSNDGLVGGNLARSDENLSVFPFGYHAVFNYLFSGGTQHMVWYAFRSSALAAILAMVYIGIRWCQKIVSVDV